MPTKQASNSAHRKATTCGPTKSAPRCRRAPASERPPRGVARATSRPRARSDLKEKHRQDARRRPRHGRADPRHRHERRAGALAQDVLRDAGVRQGRQGDLLLPGQVEVQGPLLDLRLPARGRLDDGAMWPIAFAVTELTPPSRADHQAREESGGLRPGYRLGRNRGPRRPREQPQGRQPRHPEAPADRLHRRIGLGQELAGVRHHRRGIAAADQRDLQRVRAGLHADAGAARRRLARGADDRDHPRPGTDGRQRPLHRRHRHRRQRDAAGRLQPSREAAHRWATGVLVQRSLGHAAAGRS